MVVSTNQLERLQRRYSSALYSYFRVTNLLDSYERFMKNPARPPIFKYTANSDPKKAAKRLRLLKRELRSEELDAASIAFVDWRIAETKVLQKFWGFKEQSKNQSHMVNEYLAAQVELYGPVDEELFGGIIRHLRTMSRRRGTKYAKPMDEIEKLLGPYTDHRLFSPGEETFLHYKRLFARAFPELHSVLSTIRTAEEYSTEEIVEVFQRALASVGAERHGWRAVVAKGGANVIASRYRKKIIIGSDFKPMSSIRLKQVVAHEVGCHVQRAIADSQGWHYTHYDESGEGLAILLEQLFAQRFMHKRVLRYLAISLAVGADGQKRDFCEVYDILWRVAYIITGNKPKTAKQQAFYEAARAFRGGAPSIAGAAYIKDKIYLEGNLKVWKEFEAQRLNLADFRALFRKHSTKNVKDQPR